MLSSSKTQEALKNFCYYKSKESTFENNCAQQAKQFKNEEEKYRSLLSEYVINSKQTCIPVDISLDDDTKQQVYLRLKTKTLTKTINEDRFNEVISMNPSSEELIDIFHKLKDPRATFVDVYTSWVLEKLHDHTVTRTTVFELSESKERVSKKQKRDKNDSKHSVPQEIADFTAQLYKIQHHMKRLKTYRKENVQKYEQHIKPHEPILQTYFSQKPRDQQEQKVSMNVDGQVKPFFIKRVVETKRPFLTLKKSEPLVVKSIHNVIKTKIPELCNVTFDVRYLKKLLETDLFRNLISQEFKHHISEFKKNGTVLVPSIVVVEDKKKKQQENSESALNRDDDREDAYNDEEVEEEEKE